MNWYKTARQARYPGQMQGDESRPGSSALVERIDDNELVEGKEVNILKQMIKRKDWAGVESYSQKLKNEGHSEDRVNSMLTRAMYGVRF